MHKQQAKVVKVLRSALKGHGYAIKYNDYEAVLKSDKEALNGNEEALKGDGKV